jgi:hypothetical protein
MQALQTAGNTVVVVSPVDAYSDQLRAAGFLFEDVPLSGNGTNPIKERSLQNLCSPHECW